MPSKREAIKQHQQLHKLIAISHETHAREAATSKAMKGIDRTKTEVDRLHTADDLS